MKATLLILALAKCLEFAYSANILLIFPTPSLSHQVALQGYVEELASRGHQLTIITTNVIKSLESNRNVTQIDLHDSYGVMKKKINSITFSRTPDELTTVEASLPVIEAYLKFQLENFEVVKLIKNTKNKMFDVIVLEHSFNHPYLAFAEVYDSPVIAITTTEASNEIHQRFGNVMNPLIHAEESLFPFSHDGDMSFQERWESLKFYVKFQLFTKSRYQQAYNDLIREHFPNVKKHVTELEERIQLLLLTTSPVMGYSRPMLPNAIQIGSMHIKPAKLIRDKQVKQFLDKSKKGVIVVSLGNLVRSKDLSFDLKAVFLNIFKNTSSDILWKYEDDSLGVELSNLMTVNRIQQQSDVLAHPNVKLFITQGGKLSVEEAIERGVPMIIIPLTAEQTSNARRLVNKNVAHHLELCKLNENTLNAAIDEMVESSIRQNVEILRNLLNDKPMNGRELAVWWTEYITRHRDKKNFDYPGKFVPFYAKFGLDFVAVALASFGVTLISFRFIFKKIVAREYAKLEKMKTN